MESFSIFSEEFLEKRAEDPELTLSQFAGIFGTAQINEEIAQLLENTETGIAFKKEQKKRALKSAETRSKRSEERKKLIQEIATELKQKTSSDIKACEFAKLVHDELEARGVKLAKETVRSYLREARVGK